MAGPAGIAVFLATGLFFVGISPYLAASDSKRGVWGGPAEAEVPTPPVLSPGLEAAAVMAENPVLEQPGDNQMGTVESSLGALWDPGRIFAAAPGSNLLIYKVQKGDTLSTIAVAFGITTESILSTNTDAKSRSLRVGQELAILPVTGILYNLRPQESLELVAASHGLTAEQILEFNKSISLVGSSGETIAIPSSAPKVSAKGEATLPYYKGYYVMPTTGFNWGRLHNHNGVDIANSCGTTVMAAQEGLVISAEAAGWNGGYGSFILLEHPNGTKTRYAHLQELSVSVGDYVSQKQAIGEMGTTGESTGCHLHFEVDGARNPFTR